MNRLPHVVFVCYYSLRCNSGAQIFGLANALAARGHEVTVFVPFDPAATTELGTPAFRTLAFEEVDQWFAELPRNQPWHGVLHAWTPRENVRKFSSALCRRLGCPHIVHLEDNEPYITSTNLGVPFEVLRRMDSDKLTEMIGDRLSHPHHFDKFLAAAAGVTGLIDRLMEFASAHQEQLVFWPGFNEKLFYPRPRNDSFRHSHGIADEEICLAYAGNVASANRNEVRSLYLAVALLCRMGLPARLVRAGEDYCDLLPFPLQEVSPRVVALGRVPHSSVPDIYSMADFYVQPGRSDPFNDFRFPSKLPEFFAMGRPVLLPHTNLGRFVRADIDAIVLREGSAFEIADQIRRLKETPELAGRLSRAAQSFAESNFLWRNIAEKVGTFYTIVLRQSVSSCPK